MGNGGLHHGPAIGLAGHVGGMKEGGAARSGLASRLPGQPHGLLAGPGAAVSHHHLRAFAREHHRDPLADPRSSSGHDGDFALNPSRHRNSPPLL